MIVIFQNEIIVYLEVDSVVNKVRKTECYPFWNLSDIKKMIDGFSNKELWHWRLAFMIGLLMGRRVSDTLALKWDDLYEENGNHKSHLIIIEKKTKKVTYVLIPALVWSEIELYLEKMGIDPSTNGYKNYVFPGRVQDGKEDRREAAYRTAFKKVAKEAAIPYNVNTHSTRKTFGYYGIKLHPYDPSNLDVLQKFFNHSTRAQTLNYIGLSQEKQDKYSNDWASVMSDVKDGKDIAIENTPVITLKTEDLRQIIISALKLDDTSEALDQILKQVEKKQII